MPRAEVPHALRRLAFHAGRIAPLGALAAASYDAAARFAAARLAATPGVGEVQLRGGLVRRCTPGISDIDFILIESPGARLAPIEEAYRRLRRVIPMLGEVELRTPWFERLLAETGTAVSLPYLARKRLGRHGWEDASRPAPAALRRSSRFALASQFMHRALACARIFDTARDGYGRHFLLREARKVREYCGASTDLPDGPPERLLAAAFVALDEVATAASAESWRAPEGVRRLDEDEPRPYPARDVLLGRGWLLAFERATGHRLRATPLPFLHVVEDPAGGAEDFFAAFVDFQRRSRLPAGSGPVSHPFPVSAAMYRKLAAGWFWALDAGEQRRFCSLTGGGDLGSEFRCLCEGLVARLNQIEGKLVVADEAAFAAALDHMCTDAMAVAARCLTEAPARLAGEARALIPRTVELHGRGPSAARALLPGVVGELTDLAWRTLVETAA